MPADVSELRVLAADLGKASARGTMLASKAIRKTALDIERGAKAAAPVDTGALRNSIGSTIGTLEATIGPTVHYGVYLEYGTYKMSARPYMGPAFDTYSPGLAQALGMVADGLV